jgi:hypothetical protein
MYVPLLCLTVFLLTWTLMQLVHRQWCAALVPGYFAIIILWGIIMLYSNTTTVIQ